MPLHVVIEKLLHRLLPRGVKRVRRGDHDLFVRGALFENRALLETLLERGRTTPGAVQRVVNGTPLIRVEVYRNFITASILSD